LLIDSQITAPDQTQFHFFRIAGIFAIQDAKAGFNHIFFMLPGCHLRGGGQFSLLYGPAGFRSVFW
jgi:hypothetical protein